MPNGGMLPCCFICQWAKRDEDNLSLVTPITCQQHSFAVWLPARHFCSELSDSSEGAHYFTEDENISSNHMYAWIEIQYRTTEYPNLPQYYHEFLPLATLSTYAAWSEDEKKAAYRELHKAKSK